MKKNLINDISDELEDVMKEGRDFLDEAQIQEHLEDLKTEAELLIRKHPIKSVLAGAVAGFIIAKLLRS
ncbi:MAG: hypothetical protein WD355_10785 [Balneolaceae bacterium]